MREKTKMLLSSTAWLLLLLASVELCNGWSNDITRFLSTPLQMSNDSTEASGRFTKLINVIKQTPQEAEATEDDSLFAKARLVLSTDLGAMDASLLDEEKFVWIGPNSFGRGLNKLDYLAAVKFFDLRTTFPDLDYRAHDFRLDPNDPQTVRLTARTVGTMRGDLRLRSENLSANGRRMICPPEAISMTFDKTTGKLIKLCTGFAMDRVVGNTNGQCGVRGAAVIAGSPPSEWEIYPPLAVIKRFFGRPDPTLKDEDQMTELAPFPETVIISLAKGIQAAQNGVADESLLSNDFTFSGPFEGPVSKSDFLQREQKYNLQTGFPDVEYDYSNYRMDPYDPYRVWCDYTAKGTNTNTFDGMDPTGKTFQLPPQALSYTFDDGGFCTRITADAVMDPSIGNTGGLGGVYGVLNAIGRTNELNTRPFPEIFSRLQKFLAQPFTKIPVDEFVFPTSAPSVTAVPKAPPIKPTPPKVKPLPTTTTKPTLKPTPPTPPSATTVRSPTPPKVSKTTPKAPPVKPSTPVKPVTTTPTSPVKKPPPIRDEPADPVTDAFNSIFGIKDTTTTKSTETVTPPKKPAVKVSAPPKPQLSKAPAPVPPKPQATKSPAPVPLKRPVSKPKPAPAPTPKSIPKPKPAPTITAKETPKSTPFNIFLGKPSPSPSPKTTTKKTATAPVSKPAPAPFFVSKASPAPSPKAAKKSAPLKRTVPKPAPVKTTAKATPAPSPFAFFNAPSPKTTPSSPAPSSPKAARKSAPLKRTVPKPAPATTTAKATPAPSPFAFFNTPSPTTPPSTPEPKTIKKSAAPPKKTVPKPAPKKESTIDQAIAAATSKNKPKMDKEAEDILKKAKPGATISLLTLQFRKFTGGGKKDNIPALSNWRRNRDGSITGNVSGTDAFQDGEQIETSVIASGEIAKGSVVTTKSGSKYLLK